MSITINSNTIASTVAMRVSETHSRLAKSVSHLSSGNRIHNAMDDAGGLAVSAGLDAAIKRMDGTSSNVSNAISFLQVQEGVTQSMASILDRISELKTFYSDVMKNSSDKSNYDQEFLQLAKQLQNVQSETFNGISLFSDFSNSGGGINGATMIKLNTSDDATQSLSISRSVINTDDLKQIIDAGVAVERGIGGLSYVNIVQSDAVAQIDTVAVAGNIGQGDEFSVTLNNLSAVGETKSTTVISYTATAADEAAADPKQSIRDALVTAINANATTTAFLTAASGGTTGEFTLTSDDPGDPFSSVTASTGSSASFQAQTTTQAAVTQSSTITLKGPLLVGNTVSADVDIGAGSVTATYTMQAGEEGDLDAAMNGLIASVNGNALLNTGVTASAGTSGAASRQILLTDNDGVSFSVSNITTNASASISTAATTANVSAVAQVDTVTMDAGTIAAGNIFSIRVGGTTVTVTEGTEINVGDTSDQVATALAAKINATGAVNGTVTAAGVGGASGQMTITADSAGTAFTADNATTTAGGTASNATATTRANVSAVAQVDSLTIQGGKFLTGDTFTSTINGTGITYTVGADGETEQNVRDGLVAAINASAQNGAVTAASGGTSDVLTITSDAAGTAFTDTVASVSSGTLAETATTAGAQQIQTLSITADNTAAGGGIIGAGDTYSVTITGTAATTVNYVAGAGDTTDTVRDALVAALNGDATISSFVTATASATGEITVTDDKLGSAVTGHPFSMTTSVTSTADSIATSTTTANISPISVDSALNVVSTVLGANGAEQNRLGFAASQLETRQSNIQTANSRITDVDFAAESAALARHQLKLDATNAFLSQANSLSEIALILLR